MQVVPDSIKKEQRYQAIYKQTTQLNMNTIDHSLPTDNDIHDRLWDLDERIFRAMYGLPRTTVYRLWQYFNNQMVLVRIEDLLETLDFFKSYGTQDRLAHAGKTSARTLTRRIEDVLSVFRAFFVRDDYVSGLFQIIELRSSILPIARGRIPPLSTSTIEHGAFF